MDFTALNDFTANYYKGLADGVYKDPMSINPEETALVLIDVQTCLTTKYFVDGFKAMGVDVEPMMPVLEAIDENIRPTISNIERILTACREKKIIPIHVKIESYLPDAKDTGNLHASAGMFYPPGNPATGFMEEAKPIEGEIVLKKTCSGIHVGTPIDRILRNLKVKNIIVVGFYTDQCVSTSVRDLSDLGYKVDLITDATNAMSPERHEKALEGISKIYANSEETDILLERIEKL